jgi:transposase
MRFKLNLSKDILKRMEAKVKILKINKNFKELKKIEAILLINKNLPKNEIAKILDISTETLRVWLKEFLYRGLRFLKKLKIPGKSSKLSKSEKKKLCRIIDKGPEASGFMGCCWQTPMINEIIKKEFGINFSTKYISQLLDNLGYSYKRATFVSDARDEEKRKIWLEEIWPTILKESDQKNSHILFGDECSFAQSGSIGYTWAKKGSTPIVKTSGSTKSYKVFGFIEYYSGTFYSMGYEGRMNSDIYIEFLKEVLKFTRKHLIIIQDGATYHTSEEVDDFFAEHCDRITVYQLPVCSPDYNPIEKLWKKIKEKGTHLKYFPTFDSLVGKVQESLDFFRLKKEEILSLFLNYNNIELLYRMKLI